MRVVAIIPARWGSTRFPGKPLAPIAGKPMIAHVWEKASAADGIDAVIVATDDPRIADAVIGFGGEVAMTRSDHLSGSDRLAEAAARIDADVVINLQGDEPLVRPADLAALAALMRAEPAVEVASLCHAIDAGEAANPNRVKVVRDAQGNALYFSRAPIPYPRDVAVARYFQHLGVYAYRRAALLAFSTLTVPAEECAESLEQLRFLAAGIEIRVIEVEPTGPGVDTPEDVTRVERILAGL
ncbi:MAG: 3-deoxy-manno-octulosonate cytidylyltransferase [Sphingomonadaceae bacterium]|nr:3-deoxy-manno-octulosonate cytidylyltransferase [Sphingomonadaceae bacterium]